MRKEYLYKVGQYVNVTLKIVKQTRIKSGKSTRKGYIVSSVVYPNAPTYEVAESSLKRGDGCAYSGRSPRRVCKENSLWSVKEIRNNIIDENEAKTMVTKSSGKPILFKCSTYNCDITKTMSPNTLLRHGFSCPKCRKTMSYPEKFMIVVNEYFNLGYEYQVTYEHGRFDFINHETHTVVEMNGLQHYEDKGYMNHKVTKISDSKKRKWCKENGYTLIFIDARKSDFYFIRDSINTCELLPNIKESDEATIMKMIETYSLYDIQEIIILYEFEKLTTYQIGELYNIHANSVSGLLRKNGIKLRDNAMKPKKMIRCIETGEIYDSLREASRQLNINSGALYKHLNNIRKAPIYSDPINKEVLHFEYIEQNEQMIELMKQMANK